MGGSLLSTSLLLLDAAENNLTGLTGFPGRSILQVSLSRNHFMDATKGALVQSLRKEIQLDLRGTLLENASVVQELFADGWLARSHEAVIINSTAGYYCHGITSETLRITPELFFPAQLCACLPGYKGSGTTCVPCEANTYNDMTNQTDCTPCPRHSETSQDGASALSQCQCIFGRIGLDNSSWSCESGTAWNAGDVDDSECLKCEDFKLDCEGPGHTMFSAPPEVGYARVKAEAPRAFRCGEPAEKRCNHSNASDPLGCAAGYSGPLCTTCGDGFRKKHNLCTRCADADGIKKSRLCIAAGILVLAVAATVGSVIYWRRKTSTRHSAGIIEALRPLVRVQMSVLLQFVQLWGVLAALSVNGELWEEEYVQWLQLTTSGLQDAFSLECSYGADVRFSAALAGPLVPLVLLLLCALLETVSRSMGVRMALRLLPFLFIGGASSCARLLSCQHYDAGDQALGEDAFLTLLPHLTCRDGGWQATVAASVGWISIFGYVIIIPGFLLYLMSKQKSAIAPSKRSIATAELGQDMAVVRLHAFQAHDDGTEPDSLEKEPRMKHLLAAAVAHSAVYFRGTVSFRLQENRMMQVRLLDAAETQDVENASSTASMILQDKEYTDQRRWIKITRMLTERCVFQDAERLDRILAGADRLFCKYVLFELVWFEVVLKLVSAAFVSVIDSDDAPTLCAGVALVTATTLASFQPYVQRQVLCTKQSILQTMATSGRAFIFFSIFFVADAMFKKAAKQLVSLQEDSMSSSVPLQSAGRNLLGSGSDLRGFSTGGIRKAAGAPATPALLAAQPLKWMHTPKCGTSFVNVLIHLPDVCPGVDDSFQVSEEVLGDLFELKFEGICPHVCNGNKFLCNSDVQGFPANTHMGIGHQYELLKGHLVTMMRDPIQRILSAYADPTWPHGKEFKDLVIYAHSEAHAVTCQIMTDGPMDPPPASCGDLNETDAEEAVTRLREGFAFVGLVEEWDLSICLLHRMFGGDCLASDFMDDRPTFPGDSKNHEYNSSVLQGYDDPVDRILYNGAKELFAERLLEYNVSQESCQPCFAQAKRV
ncbi:unnamed protein product [Symbiodinium microadriaticum]|nr:unnamed protein product [Symbiodinium microadriaticum]